MSNPANIHLHRDRSTGNLLLAMILLFFGSIFALATQAQTITNAAFDLGRADWGDRAMVLPYAAFDGSDLDAVAVVDGGMVVHKLRQTIGGLVTGSTYELTLDAARWAPDTLARTVTAAIYVNGMLCSVVERTNEEGMTRQHVRFVAPADIVELRIEPRNTGNGALLVDNVALTCVEPPPALEVDEHGNVALWPAHNGGPSNADPLELHVIDRAGNVVQETQAVEGSATLLNITSLPNGQYQVRNANDGAVLGRFIKL